MRKFLQSKAAVSGLCVIAVICVTGSVVDFPRSKKPGVSARTVSPVEAVTDQEILNVPPAPPLLARWPDWRQALTNQLLRADPFAFPVAIDGPRQPASGPDPAQSTFNLQAISIEPGRALAVINHRIVGTGDALHQYVVEQIHPTEVWLKSEFGRLVLPLRRTAAIPNKGSSAISPAADQPGGLPGASAGKAAP